MAFTAEPNNTLVSGIHTSHAQQCMERTHRAGTLLICRPNNELLPPATCLAAPAYYVSGTTSKQDSSVQPRIAPITGPFLLFQRHQ